MKKLITIVLQIAFMSVASTCYSAPGDEMWFATWGNVWESSPINEASGGACDAYDYVHLVWDREVPSSQPIGNWWRIGAEMFHQIEETIAEVWIGSCEETHPDGENADIDGDGVIDTEDYDPNDPDVQAGLSEEAYALMMALAGVMSASMMWFGIILNT